MAFIHSAAKPPRNVRIQQELHGTAGPGLPHAAEKVRLVLSDSLNYPLGFILLINFFIYNNEIQIFIYMFECFKSEDHLKINF